MWRRYRGEGVEYTTQNYHSAHRGILAKCWSRNKTLYWWITYLLHAAVLDKLTGCQLLKKFPAICGNRRLIAMFTRARHPSLSWTRSIQSMYPPYLFLKIHLNIILSCMPGWSPSLRFSHQNLGTPLLSLIRAAYHALLVPIDLITRIIFVEYFRSLSSSLCSFLNFPAE